MWDRKEYGLGTKDKKEESSFFFTVIPYQGSKEQEPDWYPYLLPQCCAFHKQTGVNWDTC